MFTVVDPHIVTTKGRVCWAVVGVHSIKELIANRFLHVLCNYQSQI